MKLPKSEKKEENRPLLLWVEKPQKKEIFYNRFFSLTFVGESPDACP